MLPRALLALSLALALGPARADYAVRDAAGATVTIDAFSSAGGRVLPKSVPADTTGAAYTTGNPLPVFVQAGSAVIGAVTQSGAWSIANISGTVSLPTGAATAAKQPALGTAGTPAADVISVQGVAAMTPLKVDGSAATQPVSAASLPLPSGAATAAKQPALGTAGTPAADVISVQGVAAMTPLKVDGSATTQPVSAASLPLPSGAATAANQSTANTSLANLDANAGAVADAAAAAGASGSISAKLRRLTQGVEDLKTQTVLAAGANVVGAVTLRPGADANGVSSYHYMSGSGVPSGNLVNAKGTAGRVFGWAFINTGAAARFLKFYDSAGGSTPTVGTTTPKLVVGIPAGQHVSFSTSIGLAFGAGIWMTVTAGVADTDATAVDANEIAGQFFYQ